jgi:hypothetical protein
MPESESHRDAILVARLNRMMKKSRRDDTTDVTAINEQVEDIGK